MSVDYAANTFTFFSTEGQIKCPSTMQQTPSPSFTLKGKSNFCWQRSDHIRLFFHWRANGVFTYSLFFTYSYEHLLSISSRLNHSATRCTCTLIYNFKWVIAALNSMLWISTNVVTALFGCYMAGATWNCCCLGTSSEYIAQPCTS